MKGTVSQKKPLKNETETSKLLEGMKENNFYPHEGSLISASGKSLSFSQKASRSELSWWPYLGDGSSGGVTAGLRHINRTAE